MRKKSVSSHVEFLRKVTSLADGVVFCPGKENAFIVEKKI
jgi:hypothetical protein